MEDGSPKAHPMRARSSRRINSRWQRSASFSNRTRFLLCLVAAFSSWRLFLEHSRCTPAWGVGLGRTEARCCFQAYQGLPAVQRKPWKARFTTENNAPGKEPMPRANRFY